MYTVLVMNIQTAKNLCANLKIEANDPSRRGQLAGMKIIFGASKRYAIAPVHTRFSTISWFVWDAEIYDMDYPDEPETIRIEENLPDAFVGLVDE